MNPLTTLFFPDTVIAPETVAQLLLFFEKIYHYLPAEQQAGTAPDEGSPYVSGGLCLGYPPVPLGEELDRFQKTIRDLEINVNEYGHRLQFLSLVSSAPAGRPDLDEKSISSLVGKLRNIQQNGDAAATPEHDPDAELWKARIVLKLAERFDAIHNEIRQGLAGLADREHNMFKALKGLEEDGEDMLPEAGLGGILPAEPSIMLHRMKSWSRLFVAEQKAGGSPAQHWLTTAANREAALPIFDAYAACFKSEAVVLFGLPLPSITEPADVALDKRASFHAAMGELRDFFHNFLWQISTGERPAPESSTGQSPAAREISAWTAALQDHFALSDSPASLLSFYCFPHITLPALFNLAFAAEGGVRRVAPPAGDNAIIAILESAKKS